MSKIMYANYNGIKNEANVPDAVAQSDLKNGLLVVKGTDANGKHTATLPASATDCKGDLMFVWNTIDKPELDNEGDFVIKTGEFARLFSFMKNCPVYVSADLVSGTVAVGSIFVADDANYGKLKVVADASGYKVALQVTEVVAGAQGKIYLCDTIV